MSPGGVGEQSYRTEDAAWGVSDHFMTSGILTQRRGREKLKAGGCMLVAPRREADGAPVGFAVLDRGGADVAFSSEVRPLVPALQNNRLLAIHVASMLTSYSIIGIAGVAAALYLIQGEHNRFERLPGADALNELTYRAVVVGFPILGLGI